MMKFTGKFIVSVVFVTSIFNSLIVHAELAKQLPSEKKETLNQWIRSQSEISIKKMFENISAKGAQEGAVIASPSRTSPDYFFHWVRDGALVMDVVVDLYRAEQNPRIKASYLKHIWDFVSFTESNQSTHTLTGLGEPKYHADGSSFTGPWGRPQNDGPALRAMTLIRFAEVLMSENKISEAAKLYRAEIPAETSIKRDLEYVAHHWAKPSFDLWEEVKGDHFYTRMVQRRALLMGARLADRFSDHGASKYYRKQASLIEKSILGFRDINKNHVIATKKRTEGLTNKTSGLDMAVILAANHTVDEDGFFGPGNDWILATAFRLQKEFKSIYQINQDMTKGVGFGRYPEDRYYEGNPWFLTTLAVAEFYMRTVEHGKKNGGFKVTPVSKDFYDYLEMRWGSLNKKCLQSSKNGFYALALKMEADFLFKRVKAHMHTDGSMDEQFGKLTGYMKSARDLTWSYAAFITAAKHRESALR